MEEVNSKALLDNMESAVISVDAKGKVIYCNRMAECLFQTTLENIIHKNFTTVMPELGKELSQSLKSGRSFLDILKKDGRDLIYGVFPVRENNKEVIGIVCIFQMSLNPDAEKFINKLNMHKQMAKILKAVIGFSFDGLWITDGEGKVLIINRASERFNMLKNRDVIGRKMKDLQKEGFFDKSVTLEVLRKKVSVTMIQKVRSGKSILVTGNPILDEEGNIELVITNERDITYLNKIKEELKENKALTRRYQSELSKAQLKDLEKDDVIFRSEAMEIVADAVLTVCKVDSCVLLSGESGVGKSLIAKLIHKHSLRSNGPFICVNCGAIPESLIESELFGYEKGAFTGAGKGGKAGIFEIADKGTLFLDEINTLPFHLQVKLLRFLESKEILRIGGTKYKKIDVRVIAATNQDLKDLVKKKKFREDLFFRLSVIPIYIPPLRERIDDIPPLVKFFLDKYNKKYKKEKFISPLVIDSLCEYSFPGNVRELSNLIERMVIMIKNKEIKLEDIPQTVIKSTRASPLFLGERDLTLKKAVEKLESFMIEEAIKKYKNQRKIAEILGVSQPTIARKIKKYRYNNE